jgi:2-phospho-L-lactate guanylyltransferase (CobY/MobA/RfbA family)
MTRSGLRVGAALGVRRRLVAAHNRPAAGLDGIDRNDDGQAAIEVALCLPLLVLVLLAGVQVALVVRDQIAVIGAARDAARAVVVADGRVGAANDTVTRTTRLSPGREHVSVVQHAGLITVTLTYLSPTDVPLLGPFMPDIALHGTATMAAEP